jgi:hypothetical protein
MEFKYEPRTLQKTFRPNLSMMLSIKTDEDEDPTGEACSTFLPG